MLRPMILRFDAFPFGTTFSWGGKGVSGVEMKRDKGERVRGRNRNIRNCLHVPRVYGYAKK